MQGTIEAIKVCIKFPSKWMRLTLFLQSYSYKRIFNDSYTKKKKHFHLDLRLELILEDRDWKGTVEKYSNLRRVYG